MRCRWCDTPHSFDGGTPYTIKELLNKITCPYVCITGGEPLIHEDILSLMTQLCDRGYKISLETNGGMPIDEVDPRVAVIMDIKCPGSEMEERNLWENIDALLGHHEVKFVISDRDDYDYSVEICKQHHLFTKVAHVLFSPAFDEIEPKLLASWIIEDKLPARLNLQTHKFIWPKETKGV